MPKVDTALLKIGDVFLESTAVDNAFLKIQSIFDEFGGPRPNTAQLRDGSEASFHRWSSSS